MKTMHLEAGIQKMPKLGLIVESSSWSAQFNQFYQTESNLIGFWVLSISLKKLYMNIFTWIGANILESAQH